MSVYSDLLKHVYSTGPSATVCHYTSLQHHLYRLSNKEPEAVFVQQQLPVLISCSLQLQLCYLRFTHYSIN